MPNDNDPPVNFAEAERLRRMSSQERLQWIRRRLELVIALTPTGVERAAMTEANIRIMCGEEESVG
jgi:hypothetical protein